MRGSSFAFSFFLQVTALRAFLVPYSAANPTTPSAAALPAATKAGRAAAGGKRLPRCLRHWWRRRWRCCLGAERVVASRCRPTILFMNENTYASTFILSTEWDCDDPVAPRAPIHLSFPNLTPMEMALPKVDKSLAPCCLRRAICRLVFMRLFRPAIMMK